MNNIDDIFKNIDELNLPFVFEDKDIRIFITGDKHGKLQLEDLNSENWPEGQRLTKDDYLIVAGDFGGVFYGDKMDEYVLDFYENQPWTTLFVDGNHENFDQLEKYPVFEDWHGGKVQFLRNSVIHLMRGQIYFLAGKTFFTMGGATSIDKDYRTEGKSWWPQELPSIVEYIEADCNLTNHDNRVDYIITHCCSARQFCRFNPGGYGRFTQDKLTNYFDELEKRVSFTHWYYGHHHEDIDVDDQHTLLSRRIVEIIRD